MSNKKVDFEKNVCRFKKLCVVFKTNYTNNQCPKPFTCIDCPFCPYIFKIPLSFKKKINIYIYNMHCLLIYILVFCTDNWSIVGLEFRFSGIFRITKLIDYRTANNCICCWTKRIQRGTCTRWFQGEIYFLFLFSYDLNSFIFRIALMSLTTKSH